MKFLLILSIKIYQRFLSPFFIFLFPGTGCRFYPTCSEYTILAIARRGLVKGGFLGVKRLLKCNPWS